MAKVRYFEGVQFTADFVGVSELTANAKHTRAAFDYETGATITIVGENLKVGADGSFSKGVIEKVVYRDVEGNVMLSIDGAKLAAKNFDPGDTAQDSYGSYLALLDKKDMIRGGIGNDYLEGRDGHDRMVGGAGNDTLYGGHGMDVLTGGTGVDTFLIDLYGKGDDDVITDLDIEGLITDELLLDGTIATVAKADGGEDTLVTFTNGGTLRLDGIERADFLAFWPEDF